MFILRVHSLDTEQPVTTTEEIEFYTTTSPSNHNPKFCERGGVFHLYRKASQSSLPNPTSRSTSLFVVAVPNYLSAADFIRFAGPHLENTTYLLFIRNDGMEDRYSVLIELVDQSVADGFDCSLNAKRFSPAKQDEKPACSICGSPENIWVCLIRGFMGCGRYKEGHAVRHWKDSQHCYSLELISQQIWDYAGDGYVHLLNQSKADGKSVEMNSRCMSIEGNCGSCGYGDDSGMDEAIYSSKVEAIFDEYSRLLATELEKQRQNYESLLAEAKIKRDSSIAEAAEKAVTSQMQDIQSKLDKCREEKNALAEINRNLIKNQVVWRKKVNEIEEREASQLRLKDEKILDLDEQIRDLKVYIEDQKTFIERFYLFLQRNLPQLTHQEAQEIRSKEELGKCDYPLEKARSCFVYS